MSPYSKSKTKWHEASRGCGSSKRPPDLPANMSQATTSEWLLSSDFAESLAQPKQRKAQLLAMPHQIHTLMMIKSRRTRLAGHAGYRIYGK